jgi:hypothetical protein
MKKNIMAFVAVLVLGTAYVHAQTTVRFVVNVKPLLVDSVLVPPIDYVELTGDQYPLGQYKYVRMKEEEPVDSVFSVEVTFPRRLLNRKLTYNFIIRRPNHGDMYESLPRNLIIRGNEVTTDTLYFDAFAW